MQDVLKPRVDESTLGSRARVCCCRGGGVGCCFSDLSVSFCDEAGAVTGENAKLIASLSICPPNKRVVKIQTLRTQYVKKENNS